MQFWLDLHLPVTEYYHVLALYIFRVWSEFLVVQFLIKINCYLYFILFCFLIYLLDFMFCFCNILLGLTMDFISIEHSTSKQKIEY